MEIHSASINLSMPIYSAIIINIDCIKNERGIINDSYSGSCAGAGACALRGDSRALLRGGNKAAPACHRRSREIGARDIRHLICENSNVRIPALAWARAAFSKLRNTVRAFSISAWNNSAEGNR